MKVAVKFDACDRCPIGHEQPAVVTLPFSLGADSWKIMLCDKHEQEIKRVIQGWGRLGQEVSAPGSTEVRFGEEYRTEHKRAAELRSRHVEQDRAIETSTRQRTLADVEVQLPPGAPLDGGEYEFTVHARERLIERDVKVVDVLWAASSPEQVRPGDRPGTEVRIRRGTRVVINPRTNEILTVASSN